jgi:hypothetical protein
VVGLHLLIDAVGLVVLERQDVQFGAALAIDHLFASQTGAGFGLVEAEGF